MSPTVVNQIKQNEISKVRKNNTSRLSSKFDLGYSTTRINTNVDVLNNLANYKSTVPWKPYGGNKSFIDNSVV